MRQTQHALLPLDHLGGGTANPRSFLGPFRSHLKAEGDVRSETPSQIINPSWVSRTAAVLSFSNSIGGEEISGVIRTQAEYR